MSRANPMMSLKPYRKLFFESSEFKRSSKECNAFDAYSIYVDV